MTQIRVTTDGGEPQTMSLLAMSRRLEDPATCADAVTGLVHRGRAYVVLKGGHRATVTYAHPVPAVLQSTPRPGNGRDYEINAILMFGIPAHITVPGVHSPPAAADVAKDVLTGCQPPPSGFRVDIDGDDVKAFVTGLEIALDGAPRSLGVQAMHIVDINERLQLTYDGDAP